MQSSVALSVGLPVALCIIMLGLGLSLKIDDFTRVIARPWPLLFGVLCHLAVLPALCFGFVTLFGLEPALALGFMLLAASPGGTSAAIFTHLAKGDVALSIAMAAVTTAVALVSLPLIVNLSSTAIYGAASLAAVDLGQVAQIFAIAFLPALVGAAIRSMRPDLATRLDRPVKLAATLFLAVMVLGALASQWRLLVERGLEVCSLVLVFNVLSLAVGYALPRLVGIDRGQAIALCFSLAVHNAALVIAMALSALMLNDPELAIPPAAYGLVAYLTGGPAVWLFNRASRRSGADAEREPAGGAA